MKLTRPTLETFIVDRPTSTEGVPQNLCLDKGYDYPEVGELVAEFGYTVHIRSPGEEKWQKKRLPGYRAHRWVVERSKSWLKRFRRLLIRWEKKVENHLAMLHFACAWITFRAAGVFGRLSAASARSSFPDGTD